MPFESALPRARRRVAFGRVALVCGAIVAAAAIAIACAGTFPPPGGPIRKEAAIILSFSPETSAVNVHPHAAAIQFDEVVSERGTGKRFERTRRPVPDLAPDRRSGRGVALLAHRRAAEHGFRLNTVYTITMLPGLSDLHTTSGGTERS